MDSIAYEGADREELIKIVKERSFRSGEFTLSSGKKSDAYVNLKTTALHPEGAYWIGRIASQAIVDLNLDVEAVGGLTLGADPIATSLTLALREMGREIPAFIVRKEPKGHGTDQWVEGTENFREGARVLILEDTTTTGASALKAVSRMKELGYRVEAVLTIVDREEGGLEACREAGVPLISLIRLDELRN